MRCKNCGNEIVSTGNRIKVFCSDKCRMQYKRSKRTAGYKLIPGDKVYGRPAVQYNIGEPWRLRPEPENIDDEPVMNCRGRYQRRDRSKYQINVTGSIHNLTSNRVCEIQGEPEC